ncbi:site-specific integrase [Klebsiella grimontii]|uniref:site-specific integrase n=1 Tax=Klebsiella grimontii TaxID=2058152 RepID=UPI0012B9DD9D|nr:site-specific integrase [Klebsiella grimontii]
MSVVSNRGGRSAQFLVINSQLANNSDTWADLWALIFHTSLSAGRLLALRYDDIDNDSILIRERGRLKELRVEIPPRAMAMITRRRERYPEDVFVFQSHSNRVKYQRRPVTIIAFNAALRRAARSLPDINVSSSSARNIPD